MSLRIFSNTHWVRGFDDNRSLIVTSFLKSSVTTVRKMYDIKEIICLQGTNGCISTLFDQAGSLRLRSLSLKRPRNVERSRNQKQNTHIRPDDLIDLI